MPKFKDKKGFIYPSVPKSSFDKYMKPLGFIEIKSEGDNPKPAKVKKEDKNVQLQEKSKNSETKTDNKPEINEDAKSL